MRTIRKTDAIPELPRQKRVAAYARFTFDKIRHNSTNGTHEADAVGIDA